MHEVVGTDRTGMEAPMAQYFFHCTSRKRVLVDRTGYDLPDLVEVRRRAGGVMRRCIETGAVDGDRRVRPA